MLWQGIKGFFRGLWRVLSAISRFLTVMIPLLLLSAFVGGIFIGVNSSESEPLPDKAALLINPIGALVENRTPLEPMEALLSEGGEVFLPTLIRTLEHAAEDPRITAVVMDLQDLQGPSVSQALELKRALTTFKASDKPIVVYGDYFEQGHYLLATQADEILLHPKGGINLQGYALYRNYVRQLLENIKVTMNIFRVGENKSAVEPYLRDDMSATEREVVANWLGDLWRQYTEEVEHNRGLEPGFLQTFVDSFPERLVSSDGDMAALFLEANLVDALVGYAERDARLAEWVGATDDDGVYVAIDYLSYADQIEAADEIVPEDQPRIAVVPIEGELVPGESLQGLAGADTVLQQIDNALALDNLAALVLRINSPGGSVFASEVIRQKVLEVKASGLPVVVSMAGLAASGGYYIAADADEIWAQASTLTGSIGVFAAFPSVERLTAWAGISNDGVSTTAIANAVSFEQGVDPAGARIIESIIARVYRDFISLVANGRGLGEEQVEALAGGKVWSGLDAQTVGLVDQLGDLEDAVSSAAQLAEVEDWKTIRVGTPISPEQLILEELGRNLNTRVHRENSLLAGIAGAVRTTLAMFEGFRDPGHVYVRCVSCSEML